MARIVMDASALLAYLKRESGHAAVAQALAQANDREEPILISAVNWGEIAYVVAQAAGAAESKRAMSMLGAFPIDVVPADHVMAEMAGKFKSSGKLAYADGFAAALTSFSEGELWTTDKDFESVRDKISVRMIR